MRSNITAVCISREPESWHIPSIPYYCYTAGWEPYGRDKTKERVAYLARRRNQALALALESYPDTEHVLMIDSYYLGQTRSIANLLDEYDQCDGILGASTWIVDKTRIRAKNRFFDNWTTPECAEVLLPRAYVTRPSQYLKEYHSKNGWTSVRAVGACYLYPLSVWKKNGYKVPSTGGCEHNYLCEMSGLPVWLSLNVGFWREPSAYTWTKRIRCSLHLGRFVRSSACCF